MVITKQNLNWNCEKIVSDLPTLCSRKNIDIDFSKTRFFHSAGLSIEDIAIAKAIQDYI